MGKTRIIQPTLRFRKERSEGLKILVKLFANLRDNRKKEQVVDLSEGMTPRDIMEKLEIPFEDVAIIMINGRRQTPDTKLTEDDILALFPAVGGG